MLLRCREVSRSAGGHMGESLVLRAPRRRAHGMPWGKGHTGKARGGWEEKEGADAWIGLWFP